MNRKQHIKTLESIKPSYHNVKQNSLQYAIDHLSREWVSRKTHRTLKKEFELSEATLDRVCSEYQIVKTEFNELNITNEVTRTAYDKIIEKANHLYREIDELKADNDRLQTTLDKKFEEVESWRENSIKLESDWEKESDKVSELQTQRVWLLISTSTLLIALLICLFTR